MKTMQEQTGVKLLWGTANLFSNPRYMNGAATNPDFAVVANAAVQLKNAIAATVALGGENYVFWGGREGYMSLHNTNMKRELEHMGRMLSMATGLWQEESASREHSWLNQNQWNLQSTSMIMMLPQ